MKYIVGLALVGLVLFLMGERIWAMAYWMWLGGFALGLIVCYELIAEGLSRSGDPKWDKTIKGLSDKIEAKREKRRGS